MAGLALGNEVFLRAFDARHGCPDVGDEVLPGFGLRQAEQVAGLSIVVVVAGAFVAVVAVGKAVGLLGGPALDFSLHEAVERVGEVIRAGTAVIAKVHLAVALVVVEVEGAGVYGQGLIVHVEAVASGIGVARDAALQFLSGDRFKADFRHTNS